MDGLLQAPATTAFDAVAALVSLIVYLGVGGIVLARQPDRAPARVFLVVALCSVSPYVVTILQWWKTTGVYTPAVIVAMMISLAVGSTALFHFTQVFPSRRPWIRAHGRWLIAAYTLAPLLAAVGAHIVARLMASAASAEGEISVGVTSGLLLVVLPTIAFVGLVLPFAGMMSLVNSWRQAKRDGNEPARVTTFWILISQLAGGVLAVLVLPLLNLVGVPAPWPTIFGAVAYAAALVMPLAFLNTSA